MKIRFADELYRELKEASTTNRLSIAEICNRAIRKWNRIGVASLEYPKVATGKLGSAITIRFKDKSAEELSPHAVRAILTWYLSQCTCQPVTPINIDVREREAIQSSVIQGNINVANWRNELQQQGAL